MVHGTRLAGVPAHKSVNQVDGVIQASMNAIEEVKVLTDRHVRRIRACVRWAMKIVYKAGTNSLHGSFEDRYLNSKWVHRTQRPIGSQAVHFAIVARLTGSR